MHQVASDQNEYFGHKSKKPGFLCQRLLEQMNDFHLKYIFDKNQIYCITRCLFSVRDIVGQSNDFHPEYIFDKNYIYFITQLLFSVKDKLDNELIFYLTVSQLSSTT